MTTDNVLDAYPEDDSVSTLTPAWDTETDTSGLCCEKCGAALSTKESLACRQCGWYASIGSYVEIDKSWEAASDPEMAADQDVIAEEKARIPLWAYVLSGCVTAVIVESLAARLITYEGSAVRTHWSLTQLFVGFVAFAICHTYSFILVLKNEADIKLLDYILRPIKSWSMIFRELPARSWACYCGMSGLMAVAMSILVIGGIPYERLLDWNIKEKAKFNLMGAIMEQAQNNAKDDEKSLEEAIGDFAGKAGLDDEKGKKPEKPRLKQDCIIIGYMANQAGEIQTLLLAAEHYAKLRYAGNVRVTDLPEDELHVLARNLAANQTHKPFVRISIDGATWVKPKYLCRVSYRRRGKQGGLYGAKIEDLLGEVELSGD